MAIKFVISDPKTAKSYQKDVDDSKITQIIGMKIGDEFDGGIIDLPGYKLKVTGGSNKSGFPMKKGTAGSALQSVLLSYGAGMRTNKRGLRKRKTVIGATVSRELSQVNARVDKYGKQALDSIFGTTEKKDAEKAPESK